MTLCTIELNDSDIRVASNSDIILRSPGYAVIQNDKLELGEPAVKMAHLHPRAANNRYWNNLNQDALQYPSTQVRHNADLAYAHLLSLHEQAGKPDEILFAVPGSYSNEQLSLLLGLVEACPFQAIGLVDTAVAAIAQSAGNGAYTHVDLHLHQTVLTHLNVSNEINRTSIQVIDGIGLATIYDTCAFMIADLFIKQSRFDPQHHAETEQALYNQIPQCLENLANNTEVLLEIQYQGAQHQAKLSREKLLDTLETHYQKIIAAIPGDSLCLASDRLSKLPGLVEKKSNITMLDPVSIFKACEEQLEHIRSSGPALNFITRLPKSSVPPAKEVSKEKNNTTEPVVPIQANPKPSHILHGHQAFAITGKDLFLSATGKISNEKQQDCNCSIRLEEEVRLQVESELTVFLNGQQVKQATDIQAGDIITFAGSKMEYVFINIVEA